MTRITYMLHVVGGIIILFSVIMLLPIVASWIYAEDNIKIFFSAFGITLFVGVIFRSVIGRRGKLYLRDGFGIVTALWLILSLLSALPFYLSELPGNGNSYIDAWFEAMSGLTTTGATVYSGLDNLPRALLLYRHILQWYGGLGIIVLAIAILPMLGIGGLQLYRIETSNLSGENKLTPRPC